MAVEDQPVRLNQFEHPRLTLIVEKGISEKRCIVRQDVGHQRTLIVGAVYTSEAADNTLDLSHGTGSITAAVRHCIGRHPILSAVIVGGDGERPEFATPKQLDLSNHVHVRHREESLTENSLIEKLLAEVSDEQFSSVDSTPPWKLVLTPLRSGQDSTTRLLVLFAYYHSHGDGKSGLAFHQSFLEGLSQNTTSDQITSDQTCEPCLKPLPPPIEKAGKLSLSWSFLLSPLIGTYIPSFLASALGFRASWIAQSNEIWRGKDHTFDPNNFQTGLTMFTIDHDTMHHALQRCKARQTTFTALLTHLIAQSLSELVPAPAFAAQIVIDLRHLFEGAYTAETMTNCVSAYSELIPGTPPTTQPAAATKWTHPANPIWLAARKTRAELVAASSTLHNQPIGLLQYLSAFRPWTLSQIGKPRESSYEISNLVVFDPVPVSVPKASARPPPGSSSEREPHRSAKKITIEKTFFSQPANAAGACLNFNCVSTKGGPLVGTVTWQRGVLGLGEGKDEGGFVRRVCGRVGGLVEELAGVAG